MPKNAKNQKKSIFSKSYDGIQIVPLILNFPNCPGPPRRKFGRGYHSMYLELDSGTVSRLPVIFTLPSWYINFIAETPARISNETDTFWYVECP